MKKALFKIALSVLLCMLFITVCSAASEEAEAIVYSEGQNDLVLSPNHTVMGSWDSLLLGDVNMDGVVTNADALMLFRYVYDAELYPLPILCNHTFGEWTVAAEPDCIHEGLQTRTCSRCHGVEEKAIAPNNIHTVVIDPAVAPTCTEAGLTAGTHCSVCQAVFIAQEVVDAPGHTEVIDQAVLPSCSTTGLTEGKHCSVCNEILEAQELVDALPHKTLVTTFTETTVTAYTKTNSSTYPFSVSGNLITSTNKAANSSATYTIRAVRALTLELQYLVSSELNYDKLTITHNATVKATASGTSATAYTPLTISMAAGDTVTIKYTKDGSTSKGDDCAYVKLLTSATQTVQEEKTELIAIDESNRDALASCTEDILCAVCGEVAIEQKAHTGVIDAAVAPTCTATGLTEGKHCSACGEVLLAQEVVPVSHSYAPSFTPPTATTDGYTQYDCTSCGDSYTADFITPTDFVVTGSNRDQIGYAGTENEALTIPAVFEHDGTWYRVTGIGASAFEGCASLASINIPESVTGIGQYAFRYCSCLTSIVFKNTNGWKAGSTAIDAANLADPAMASQYLRATYFSSTWTRS